jgi:hypothetical protein
VRYFSLLYYTPAAASTTTTLAIDLFTFYPPLNVLICKLCSYAVPPTTLSSYIRVYYLKDARYAATNPSASLNLQNAAPLLAAYLCKQYYLLDLATTKILTLLATDLLILELILYSSY